MSMEEHIQQRIDRLYPRLDVKLRALLVEFAAKAEELKPSRYTSETTPLDDAAGVFLTRLFDESDRPKYQPTTMVY